ncbi:uncharacterized protein LOC105920934 [Fundulus heteroclitus]|uniref:uncharacterized protein LOC105920934 n=1 Tax=Fundulus heteroclitus TaxID=8078 RepID=UPI00165B8DD8|nr:uncharacterized protein LOC105920934 [Fundulus heteroclitus]
MATKKGNCYVRGCSKTEGSFHLLPKDEKTTEEWLKFIYGEVPRMFNPNLRLCSAHFTEDCFLNMGEFKSGFSNKLILRKSSVPTLKGATTKSPLPKPSKPQFCNVHCQTESKCSSRGTQLGAKTLAPKVRSQGTQTSDDLASAEIVASTALGGGQPFASTTARKGPTKQPGFKREEDFDETTTEATEPASQPVTTATESSRHSDASGSAHEDLKFIVFEKCLLELFKHCPVCARVCDVMPQRRGTLFAVRQRCPHCQYFRQWRSQPCSGSIPLGNLQLAASIYFTGSSYTQLQKVFRAMKIATFGYRTFRRYARTYLEPAVICKWKKEQDEVLEFLSPNKVMLGGDMRAESPGHSAKYGSYTLMNLESNKVIDIQLVKSNEVGGSNNMEKEGLKRCLDLLRRKDVEVDYIVTDRHPQVQKFLREQKIQHFYDAWHVEKGLTKKLTKIGKEKDCELVQKWVRSIRNHIYWTATSSTSGPEKLAKWQSLVNHIQDVHTHDHPLFPQCLHPEPASEKKKKWLQPGSKALYKVEKVLLNRRVLKDVEKLSSNHRTSAVEAFHNVIHRFAPKNVVFPYTGMLSRLYLAAMHFNENSDRPPKRTPEGRPGYKLLFPKNKKGGHTVKVGKEQATYCYAFSLMKMLFEEVLPDPSPYFEEVLRIPIPADLSAQYEQPLMEEVVA